MPNAPAFSQIGTQANGQFGTTVSWPTHSIHDFAVLPVETTQGSTDPTVSAGWTAFSGSPLSDGTGGTFSKFSVFYKFADSSSEGNVTVDDVGNHEVAMIATFSGVNRSNPINAIATSTKTAASTTGSFPSVTTTVDNCLILLVVGRPTDSSSTTFFSNFVNINLSGLTEAGEAGTTDGNGGGFAIAYGTKATAGSTGTTTFTCTNSTNTLFTVALAPAGLFVPKAVIF